MEQINEKTAFSLGVFIGEFLIFTKIPCLSCNPTTNNVIQVTYGEAKECERLCKVWSTKVDEENKRLRVFEFSPAERFKKEQEVYNLCQKEWNEDMKFRYSLKKKYLPHILKSHIPYVDFSDEETNKIIKKGLISSLWDWDFCDYSLKEENIVFENDKYSQSYVTLELDLEKPSSYTGEDWI